MTDILLLAISIAFLYLGNKAFNVSMENMKQTDPPSDFSEVGNPKLLAISFGLVLFGCWLFYLFIKSQV